MHRRMVVLPAPYGTEQGNDFSCRGVEPHVQAQRSVGDHDVGAQCHNCGSPPPSHLPRRATRTPKETTTMNSATTIA